MLATLNQSKSDLGILKRQQALDNIYIIQGVIVF